MRLMVCPRERVPHYAEAPVTHFVSLIDPDEVNSSLQTPVSAQSKLQLIFNDLDDIEMKLKKFKRYVPPQEEDVEKLVAFGRTLGDLDEWGLLAHCEAGISRSTAAAITILTAAGYRPQTAFSLVRRVCPEMLPNRRMLRIADRIIGTDGRLHQMAEVHRRKAFLRAGYEDPTNVLWREQLEAATAPKGLLQRLFDAIPNRWRSMVGSGARMRDMINSREAGQKPAIGFARLPKS